MGLWLVVLLCILTGRVRPQGVLLLSCGGGSVVGEQLVEGPILVGIVVVGNFHTLAQRFHERLSWICLWMVWEGLYVSCPCCG